METFLQFCTRRTGFGKTSWWQFGVIQLFVAVLVYSGVTTWDDAGWVGIAFAVAIEVVLVYGTWMNYTGRWK
jgi:hypothetical protein